ncbi:hypothetical protein Pan153_45300 [Gimesia panareensis]|uniref:Uncharacterized protein n=1 Tax=Gimesia panareensis TaxID=2527978 RepID=A0A518FU39_9PLAN|nr:hypothetical protein [Gimesia panareensis]QDV19861.1 hypothetical protein Pan153_45300 [Gimesia panareensis]
MKFRTRWPLTCLLLIFLVLLIRLFWTLGVSPDSWRLFADEWRQQILSLTSWEIPVPYRTPAEQATYWVAQTNEIDATHQDPQVALGAAWMLDTSCDLYRRRHFYTTDFNERRMSYLLTVRREWERETVDAMQDDFEPIARKACLEQSELATNLAPGNKHLWRNRALLLFQLQDIQPQPIVLIPRQENWQEILDECARHDPDNALYDYLAAIYLWSISSQLSPQLNYEILDPPKFQLAQQKLSAGLKKPFLKTGYTGESDTFAFLSHTSYTLNQQLSLVQSKKNDSRALFIQRQLFQALEQNYSTEFSSKQYAAATVHLQDQLKLAQQISAGSEYYSFPKMEQIYLSLGLVKLDYLKNKDPTLFEAAEYKSITEKFRQALINLKIYNEARQRIHAEAEVTPDNTPRFFRIALLAATSLNLVFITLAGAILAGGLSWLGMRDSNSESVRMGVWRSVICWILGTAISLVLWGLFPAQIVPLQLQYTLLRWMYWIGYVLFILGLLYLIHAFFSVGLQELFVMGCILSMPVLIVCQITNLYRLLFNNPLVIITAFVLVLLAGMLTRHYSQKLLSEKSHSYTVFFLCCGLVLLLAFIVVPYGFNLARVYQIPANLMNPIYPVTWRSILGMHPIIGIPENNFTLFQLPATQVWLVWYWRAGELFGVFISLSLLCLWYLKCQSRMMEGGFPALLQNRKRFLLHHAGLTLAKSCAVVALLCALVYLTVAPGFLQARQTKLMAEYDRLVDRDAGLKKIRALQAEIKADPIAMDQIRKQIAENEKMFSR